MKKRRFLSLFVALIMLFTIAMACGNDDTPAPTPATPPADDSASAADPPTDDSEETPTPDSADDREYFEFENYANYDWFDTSVEWGADVVSAYMKELFNIGMRLSKPDIDPDQMMGIMITSGELPDVMMIERDSVYQQLVELDMLLPLDEFIENSQYRELLGDGTINMSRINGNVYGLLNWATSEPTGNVGWAVNRAIWEELGSPQLETTQQMFDYLIMVRDANLTVDGMSVIPLQFSTDFHLVESALSSFGVRPIDGVADVGGELKLYMTAPGAQEAFLWLNSLWNENLINQDHFVELSEQIG